MKPFAAAVCIAVTSAACAQAPARPPVPSGPASVAAELQRAYGTVKPNILKSADLMPAADYLYKATPEVRTYARVLTHITEAQFRSCGTVNGTTPISKPPAETAGMAAVVASLKESFAECDRAYAETTDANALSVVMLNGTQRTRIGILFGNVAHDNEQYATLALYLRLKGIAPPSSEK